MRDALCTLLFWTAALAVRAAEPAPVSTAPADDQPPLSTDAQIELFLSHADEARPEPAAVQPRKIHGVVGAAIGTGGHRSAYGAIDLPFGQNNSLGLAAESTRFPSRHGRGGGTRQSLAVDLNINGPLGGGEECMRRTGTPLLSDAGVEARCAEQAINQAEPDR